MLVAKMSSFADLTPVSLTASSSTTDEHPQIVNRTKLNDFHQLVAELGFDEASVEHNPDHDEIQIRNSPERAESSDDEEEEEEDLNIKYPYQRKDQFEGIEKRLEQRLNNSDNCAEADQELWEIQQTIKEEQEKRKAAFSERSFFSCVVCAKFFTNAQELQKHAAKAHDLSGNKHKCKLCGKAFKHQKNLVLHESLHLSEHKCTNCSLVFQSAATLETHIARFHSEKIDKDDHTKIVKKCDICKERFPEETYKKHTWYCKNKERVLAKKAEKNKEKALSVPPSPAMSTTSYASFTSLQPGTSYSSVTSPVVSYVDKSCKVCGETFASRQSMIRHVGRKHPEVKGDPNVTAVRFISTESPTHAYACEDCGKRLTTRAALTTHRARIHLNTNRHECHICKKSYPLASEMRKHIQRVHEKAGTLKSAAAAAPLSDLDEMF